MIHVNLMITPKQKLIINTPKKKRKDSKHNQKESHQTTREEGRSERNDKNNQKITNKMAISRYLAIITLNVSGLTFPIKRHRVAVWIKKEKRKKSKTHVYASKKRIHYSLQLRTHID